MTDTGSITYIDYSAESSTVKVNTVDVDETNLLTISSELAALDSAIQAITLGAPIRSTQSIVVPLGGTPPLDQNAQRERKWLVTATVTGAFPDVGKTYTYEIPCADLAFLTTGTDVLFRSNQNTPPVLAVQTFIDAFEQVARSPAGSDLSITKITSVGRNL